ncbi:BA3454 family stress response protein [Bacillus salipaludis]|uniref:BA3454 family stress response protein n=1 Tax=Bacillus salipaludis TaxID=2547811 RepID=A0ABW8RKL6_9BACI
MIEVTVTVSFKGKNYKTNVIAKKGITNKAIKSIAENQVLKQWGE